MGKGDDLPQKGNLSPQSEASKMLEAALLQMDGIISGATSQPSTDVPSSKADGGVYGTLHEAAQNLANLISKSGSSLPPPNNQIRSILLQWINSESSKTNEDPRIYQLEQDKEALQMHVSVLSEQIEAQSHKINDLEKQLQDKKQLLINAEDLLQREMLSRSSLETQKLELMSAMSELKLHQASLEQKNIELRSTIQNGNYVKKPPIPTNSPIPQTSTPNHQTINNRASPSPSPIASARTDSNNRYRHYGSLPRETTSFSNNNNNNGVAAEQPQQQKKGVAFAETEKVIPQSPPLKHNTLKTKIFGTKQKQLDSSFQRNDWTRSTAGPRLCPTPKQKRITKPYAEFTNSDLCEFLEEIGLEMYCDEVRTGSSLPEIIKNPLHRKKWQLAVNELDGEKGAPGELDTNWVLRWLDDTGLPQHKDAFANARIDGRMLHMLTMDDLATLHVTSMLHVCSLKRGIQILRECDWDGECLIRRGMADESQRHSSPSEIVLWSAHRVMEWLRACDLAEYAPNLRGAGVHGALMIYEPKFTAELMATLLNIPPSKTLLRRHLSTHFKELLGRDVIQQKRELEATLGYVPLTPGMKLKVVKKSQFSLLRKKSKTEEVDLGDLVCPLPNATSSHSGDELTSNNNADGTMRRISDGKELAVYHLANDGAGPNGGGLNDVFQKKSDSILV